MKPQVAPECLWQMGKVCESACVCVCVSVFGGRGDEWFNTCHSATVFTHMQALTTPDFPCLHVNIHTPLYVAKTHTHTPHLPTIPLLMTAHHLPHPQAAEYDHHYRVCVCVCVIHRPD